MTRSKIIGVTGVSGSGKTTVTRILQSHGAYAVIADELAHEAILKGAPPYLKILEAFGAGILGVDGEIDRKKLGGIVFGKPALLKVLEGIIHPYVIELTDRLIRDAMDTGAYSFAVIDAPMLIEAGMHEHCDEVWLVTAPDDVKLERIMKRDGITVEAAKLRLAARSEAGLLPFADKIINNDGSMEKLNIEVESLLK
jgi:dephospho-CoA kinase